MIRPGATQAEASSGFEGQGGWLGRPTLVPRGVRQHESGPMT